MFSAKDVIEATSGRLLKGDPERRFAGVSTDTRNLKREDLFIAIKGPNFDGHDFIGEARSKGAIGALVSRDVAPRPFPSGERAGEGFVIIEVKDTVKALGDIAKFHRKRFDIPVIAVTGSNGKTTAKDMTAQVLSVKYNVLKNEGTENNFIGVPQTLLRLKNSHKIAVIELGTNHFGEIARLAEMIQPSCGVIINIGPSHLEFFGNVDNVREEKLELLKYLGGDCACVVNGDDRRLVKDAETICEEVVTFGLEAGGAFMASGIKEEGGTIGFVLNNNTAFRLNVLGKHNVYNALAAIAVGSLYGISPREMAQELEKFKLPKLRMESAEMRGIRFIFDCYNSNPYSMASAIETLKAMDCRGRKIIVAGDMLELGTAAPQMHREIGKVAAQAKTDILMGVGPLSGFILEGAQEEGIGGDSLLHFENSVEASRALKDILREGDLVLVKGSRGMKMEEIKNCFTTYSTR